MSSISREKYGQKQQIGFETESGMASHHDSKVKSSQHESKEIQNAAVKLAEMKEWKFVEPSIARVSEKFVGQYHSPPPSETFR
jgi:hypothetical protein